MKQAIFIFALAPWLLLLPGCGGDDGAAVKDDGESADKTTPGTEPDDPQAVAALESLGAKIKRDAQGFVEEVDLRGTDVDDAGVYHLTGLRRVRRVYLAGTAVTDFGLFTIGHIYTIDNLDLRKCPITNQGIGNLYELSRLRALKLSGEEGITDVDDAGVAPLGDLTNLEVLAFDKLWVGAEGLAQLAQLKKLKELYLRDTLTDDEALVLVGGYPRMRKLRLAANQVTEAGLSQLTNLTELQELDLSECALLTDDAMSHVGQITSLTNLNLWRVPITDAGVAHLAGLTNMTNLNLDNTQLTDNGLQFLGEMRQLTILHIGSTPVTDAGVEYLEPLTALNELNVSRTGVTQAGADELKKKLPDIKIQLEYLGEG